MTTLIEASRQWMTRPADERYNSVAALHDAALGFKDNARSATVPTKKLRIAERKNDLVLCGAHDEIEMTNWSFDRVADVAAAPAGYMRSLPAKMAAECLNHGLQNGGNRDNKLLFQRAESGMLTLRALTSTKYGRIWNSDITRRLVELEEIGPWQPAPAAFDGSRGLYLGDRDMFAFMVDNDRRIFEKGPGGGLSRGFFVSNSEVGAGSFRILSFFYNYICGNHMVWGASGVREVRIRHIGDADGRAFGGENLYAELKAYAESSGKEDEMRVQKMRTYKIGKDLDDILDVVMGIRGTGLTKKNVTEGFELAKQREDWYGDPTTVWGLAGGITEIARDLPNADERTALEAAAGKMVEIAF